MSDPRVLLAEVIASQERLERTLDALDEAALRAPSPLEGWTRGHVVRHLAGNADSYTRLLLWAATGVEHPQYAGREARAEEIEAGAHLPYELLVAQVREADAAFVRQAESLTDAAWRARVRALGGWTHPGWYTLARRWREVEVHHVDLAAGYTPADWPVPYLRWELAESLPALRGHVPYSRIVADDLGLAVETGGPGPALHDGAAALLGWLTGRVGSPHSPTPPWPYPAAVDWSKA